MEININKLSIAHQKDKIIKIFDDKEECIKFAEKFEKKYGINLHCDPLYAFLITIGTKEYWKGMKDKDE